ncbi:MAG: hypothetical protein HZB51_01920 [Chloroflexi bacterium]|nr:hypothetical protein [Chloroflexota bacterium]
MSRNFILAIMLGTVVFLGIYLVWTTWVNPRPTVAESASAVANPTVNPNITIVPSTLNKEGVPSKAGSLALTQTMTGTQALAEFAQLHGKGFDLLTGYMAHYGKDEALLWVGQAKDDKAAIDMVAQMAEKIGPDNAMFKDLNELNISGRRLFTATGQGQQHFFYAVNDKIVWLAASPEQGADALHSLWSAVR